MTRRETDPMGNYNFIVEIEGMDAVLGFSEVTGLDVETEVIEYRAGNERTSYPRKLPGLHRVGNVTLKRGITGSTEVWDWRRQVLDGSFQRRSMSIILLDETRTEIARWNLFECWPVRYKGPALRGEGNDIAIETLVIAAERLDMA